MDMNTNRYEKPVQTPSRGVEGAAQTVLQLNSANQRVAE